MRIPRQDSEARSNAANINLITARSLNAWGDHLRAPALLTEQPLHRFGRSGRVAMRKGQLQMRDAGGEVVQETRRGRRQLALVGAHEFVAQQLGELRTGRRVRAPGRRFHLRPLLHWHLGLEVAHLVRQASLPQRARTRFLQCANQAGSAIAADEQRIAQVSILQIAQEVPTARRVLFGPRRQPEQHLLAFGGEAPTGEHRLSRLSQMQPLGNPVDKQVDHFELGQIARRKRQVVRPQPLGQRRDRRARTAPMPVSSRNAASISRVDSPRAYISTASRSSSSERPLITARIFERNGSARSATCGTAYSIAPSAGRQSPSR